MDTGADQTTCGGTAWIPLHDTGEKVRCNGYYQGETSQNGPIVPVMSLVTCGESVGNEPILLLVHQACYIKDAAQTESLCHPYQAMAHGVNFDLTPVGHTNELGKPGKQCLTIEDRTLALAFDGRKMYINIRRPTRKELNLLEIFELTSPDPFEPNINDELKW